MTKNARASFLAALSILPATACAPYLKGRPAGVAAIASRGMVYTGYDQNAYSTANNSAFLTDMQAMGSNFVSILVTCYTNDTTTSSIDCSSSTPSSSSVTAFITAAHAQGFKVDLRVYVDLKNGTWRGNWDPTDKATTFSNLQSTLVTYATLAQSASADSFTIGAEYVSLTKAAYTSNWQSIITAVRAQFSKAVTYASESSINSITGSREYLQVGFWNNLDTIGFTHYDAYNGGKAQSAVPFYSSRPTYAQMLSLEQTDASRFATFAAGIGKPWALSEVGFPGARNASYAPYSWTLTAPVDPIEAAIDYGALLEAFTSSTISGIYLWQYGPYSGVDKTLGGTAFGLVGRPAFDVVKSWFQ